MSSERPAAARTGYPGRVICLTEETTEVLYRIGAGDLVVGVSGYTARPPEARLKPRVSSFLSARHERIDELQPDLVLSFSDLQADVVHQLVKRGHQVVTFNQRSISEIYTAIQLTGALVGYAPEAQALVEELRSGVEAVGQRARSLPYRPRVFFEEWFDPMICGIRWVSELIEIAGGTDVFRERARSSLARDRIVSARQVIDARPDAVIASWCGRKVRTERIAGRTGFRDLSAVRNRHIYEIKSTFILQPGPAALTEGLLALHRIMQAVTSDPPTRSADTERSVADLRAAP